MFTVLERESSPDTCDDHVIQAALDLSPAALLLVQDGIVRVANAAALAVTGSAGTNALVGRRVAELLHPQFAANAAPPLGELGPSRHPPCARYRIRRSDGRDAWVEAQSVRATYNGRPAAVTSLRDITQETRRMAELQALHALAETLNREDAVEPILRNALAALRATTGSEAIAALLPHADARLRLAVSEGLGDELCRRLEGLAHWPAGEGEPAPILVSDPDPHRLLGSMSAQLREAGIASLALLPIVHRRRLLGAFCLGFDSRQAFADQAQRLALAIAENVGIGLARLRHGERTRRTHAQLEERVRRRTRQLEEANRELEAFSYSVSHDLRSPLRAMNGFSTLLLAEYGERIDATGHSYLERIVKASRRMEVLIDDLLRLSRVNRFDMEIAPVDLSEIARETAAKLNESAPLRRIDWDIEPDMRLEADAGLMRILIENLLENAWKYTGRKEHAQIRFFRRSDGQRTRYVVADNGAGFDMRYADKLFAPFQRLHSPAEFEGTGIGLALVQRIVSRLGGSVRAHAAHDKGASFEFTFWDDGIPEEIGKAAHAGAAPAQRP